MVGEKKNNMATRFCKEIIADIEKEITFLNKSRDLLISEAGELEAQIKILDKQINVIEETLAKGNYEKDNGKDAQREGG